MLAKYPFWTLRLSVHVIVLQDIVFYVCLQLLNLADYLDLSCMFVSSNDCCVIIWKQIISQSLDGVHLLNNFHFSETNFNLRLDDVCLGTGLQKWKRKIED